MLPHKVVVVVESIVGKHLWIGIGADVIGVVRDALPGKPDVRLRPKRNAYL